MRKRFVAEVAAILCLLISSLGSAQTLDYTVSYDGTTTTIFNLPESGFVLSVMPLVGVSAGSWYALDPGSSETVSPDGSFAGGAYPIGGCPGGYIAAKGSIVITGLEDGCTWTDKTDKTSGKLDTGDQKTFPSDHEVSTTGSVRKGTDYLETTSGTEVTWHPDLPQLLLNQGWGGNEFAELIGGSITSYGNAEGRDPVFTSTVAVGVPEPTTLSLVILGGLALLLRRRK